MNSPGSLQTAFEHAWKEQPSVEIYEDGAYEMFCAGVIYERRQLVEMIREWAKREKIAPRTSVTLLTLATEIERRPAVSE